MIYLIRNQSNKMILIGGYRILVDDLN